MFGGVFCLVVSATGTLLRENPALFLAVETFPQVTDAIEPVPVPVPVMSMGHRAKKNLNLAPESDVQPNLASLLFFVVAEPNVAFDMFNSHNSIDVFFENGHLFVVQEPAVQAFSWSTRRSGPLSRERSQPSRRTRSSSPTLDVERLEEYNVSPVAFFEQICVAESL